MSSATATTATATNNAKKNAKKDAKAPEPVVVKAAEPVAVKVPEPVKAAEPAAKAKGAAKKDTAKAVVEPVAALAKAEETVVVKSEPVVADEAAAVVSDEEAKDSSLDVILGSSEQIRKKIGDVSAVLHALKADLKLHDKMTKEYVKRLQKSSKSKGKRKRTGAVPPGFVTPVGISKELAVFLGLAEDTQLPRQQVTKKINEYIKANKLQDPANGRFILPDDKLKGLLDITAGTELTYFTLQSHMKKHFIKLEKVAAPVVA
jgi:chromatin remodeling complex protein RSC6